MYKKRPTWKKSRLLLETEVIDFDKLMTLNAIARISQTRLMGPKVRSLLNEHSQIPQVIRFFIDTS